MPEELEVVLYAHPQRLREAEKIAQRFNLPLATGQGKNKYKLYLGPEKLELHCLHDAAIKPLSIDFTRGRSRYRRLWGGGRNQPLAKAAGIKGSWRPAILDATAGFGRDALVLAGLGCRVTLLERSPVLAALLADALARASLHTETMEIAARINLHCIDALTYLKSPVPADAPDTIYLDPMYPHRSKTALVKKEMRIARDLAGDDNDAAQLLEQALKQPVKRIVVKRPQHAEQLGRQKADAAVNSKNTRYDIYFPGHTIDRREHAPDR